METFLHMKTEDLPRYVDLVLPTIRAVSELGKSARAREITQQVLEDLSPSDEVLAVTYPERPQTSVYLDRLHWARSYAKLIGSLESPSRGVFLMTELGRSLLSMDEPDAQKRVRELDRKYRRARGSTPAGSKAAPDAEPDEDDEVPTPGEEEHGPAVDWQEVLLARLHRLDPTAFEEFVLYLLRRYGLELERVGGTGDEGVDGIGVAPLSPVLSSRVAVQVKRSDPNGKGVGRETVALFQRDAQTKGAERAILVTLGKFSAPARKAAILATPTVDLIDGEKLADLVLEQKVGVTLEPIVNEAWFDRFD